MFVIKKKLKYKDFKYCLETTQPENNINQPWKTKLEVDSLQQNHKQFVKLMN